MIGIYIITSLCNQKVYIGQSVNIEKRFATHKDFLKRGTHQNKHLQSAWNKYGENNFIFSVIEECSENKLTEREQYWIDFYGGINSKKNYNFRDASSKGKMSTDSLKRMSESTKRLRQNPEWVKKNSQAIKDTWTDERRKSFSELKKGKPLSDAHRQALKDAGKKRQNIERPLEVKQKISNTLKGHIVTEETKEKLRQAAKNQPRHKMTNEQKKHISEGAKKGWETRRRNMEKEKNGIS